MYCSLDDIKKLLPEDILEQLTDDEGLGTINQARVDEAIAGADAEIDGYLGGRYSVPLSAATEIVKKLSVDIAIYNLYSRAVASGTIPELRSERYRNAIKQLEGVSKGMISIGVDEKPASSASSGGAESNKPTDTNVFSRRKLEGF